MHKSSRCSAKIAANGVDIFYERAGTAKSGLLCIPGALGTTQTDFGPQLKSAILTASHSVIAIDPRGYGHSRPPNRTFTADFLHQDARDGFAVMRALGFEQFSLMGWSDGGNSAVILAASEPVAIRKMVIWGGNSFITDEDMQLYERTKNVDSWSKRHREAMESVYGSGGLREMWSNWSNTIKDIYAQGGDLYKQEVGRVRCPTFLLHGAKDPLVPRLHVDYLKEAFKCPLQYHEFPDGKHNIHLRYADEFNRMVFEFLASAEH